MTRKPEKTKKKRASVKGMLKVLGVLVVCVYAIVVFAKQQLTLSKCGKVSEDYKDKISEAQLEHERLEDELSKAGTDEYLERVAREKLGLVKANERVFIDITGQ